jgi:hypothetical protein
MAKRIVAYTTIQPTATADTTNLVDSTYPFILQGGSATQRTAVTYIYLGGQATASAPMIMLVSMDSTVGTSTNTRGTGQTDAPVDSATAALAAIALTGNAWATTKPQRAATLHLHNMSFNAFGGISTINLDDRSAIVVTGASANTGELSVSSFTGSTATTPIGGSMVYETL